jgi:hypothetical protein
VREIVTVISSPVGGQHFIAVLLELQLFDDGRLASDQFATAVRVTGLGFNLSTFVCSSGNIPL